MATLCRCGHAKSQHHNGTCDYRGHSCNCTGYRALKPHETITHKDVEAAERLLAQLFDKKGKGTP